MLSQEDNEVLARVGPGTAMGGLLRQYWQPLLYAGELEPDGNPLRVRLLGENLIAFRNTDGQVGLVGDHCPHRGASLYFGRNEENGLRCVYHGWKFDVAGNCVDMPNEPPESNFKDKVHHTAYPCLERGGVIWSYLGPRPEPPPLPDLEWTLVGEKQRRHAWRAIRQCNWAQALEGDLDTSHPYFLHGRIHPEDPPIYGFYHPDTAPQLFVMDTDVGVMYASRRDENPGSYYWRVSQFMLPNMTLFPADAGGIIPGHMWVPVDDDSTLIWCVAWNPLRDFTPDELDGHSQYGSVNEIWSPNAGPGEMLAPHPGRPYPHSWPKGNAENDYLQDRAIQRAKTFTGIPTIPLQDDAVTASMGAITDRSREHLGTADAMIIQTRRRLLAAARALQHEGTTPPGVDDAALFRKRSSASVLARDLPWADTLKEWLEARSNALA